jgi:hypothetical protein
MSEDANEGETPKAPKPKRTKGKGKAKPKAGAKPKPGEWRPEWKRKEERRQERARARASEPTPPAIDPIGSKFQNVIEGLQGGAQVEANKERILDLMVAQALSAIGAGKEIGLHRSTVWRYRRDDPDFAKACDQAWKDGTDSLKDAAAKLAMGGDAKMLSLLIPGRDHSFRDPKFATPNPGPATMGTATVDLDDLTPEERAVLRKIAERQAAKALERSA